MDGAEDEEGCKLGLVEGWFELDGSWEGKLEGWELIDGELDFTKLGAVVVDGFILGSFVGWTLKLGWFDGYGGEKEHIRGVNFRKGYQKDTKNILKQMRAVWHEIYLPSNLELHSTLDCLRVEKLAH